MSRTEDHQGRLSPMQYVNELLGQATPPVRTCASWLNLVEIEIGVMRTQCLDRRIPGRAELESELATWQRRRNTSKDQIHWMFDCQKARQKLAHAYSQLLSNDEDLQAAA